jgi:hypothetical protein
MTADSRTTEDDPAPTQGSFPPPPPRRASASTPQARVADTEDSPDGSTRTPSETEALAKVAMLAARSSSRRGPSRAVVGAALGIGVLLVALVLLAIIVSIGPDPDASSVR